MIEKWYRENVIGGVGSFIVPAQGFDDDGRAIRQKFVFEISGSGPPPRIVANLIRQKLGYGSTWE